MPLVCGGLRSESTLIAWTDPPIKGFAYGVAVLRFRGKGRRWGGAVSGGGRDAINRYSGGITEQGNRARLLWPWSI